ncbi:MAG: ligase-associated DNA damage response endonuclease PdeM [Micropepsaceae bacterium]
MFSFRLAGEELVADHKGALWWPSQQLLAFADLHLEKGSSYASRTTQLLPPYDTRATLTIMHDVVDRFQPKRIICLGDNFHDREGPERLDALSREAIQKLMCGRRFVWIEGNHDAAAAASLGGESAISLQIGPVVFCHEPSKGEAPGEVAGHLHPVVTVNTRLKRLRRKCFATDGKRCVMPALGAFTGGLDIFDEAFADLFSSAFYTLALGRDRVYPFRQASVGATEKRLAPGIGLKLR